MSHATKKPLLVGHLVDRGGWRSPAIETILQALPGIEDLQERAERIAAFAACVPEYNQPVITDALLNAKTPVEATRILEDAERAQARHKVFEQELAQARRAHDGAVSAWVQEHTPEIQSYVLEHMQVIVDAVPNAIKRQIAEQYDLPVPKGARLLPELVDEFETLHRASRELLGTSRQSVPDSHLKIVHPDDLIKLAQIGTSTGEVLRVIAQTGARLWAPTAVQLRDAAAKVRRESAQ